MKRKFYLLSSIFQILILFIILVSRPSPAISETASRFALLNDKDELIRLTELLKNNNIILTFWASFCAPCKKEIPQLIGIEKKYGKTKNIRLILINTDKEGKEKAIPALKEINISHECLFDIYQITLKKYSLDLKIPASFLINKKGKILFKAIGESEENIHKLEKATQEMR